MKKTNPPTFPHKIFPIDCIGFIYLSDEDSYFGKNILNAEMVGRSQTKANGDIIVKRYNMHNEAMDIILAFIRESKSNTTTVKKAVEFLNKNKY